MGAVRRKQLGLAVVDITDLAAPKVAAFNGDEMLYAASLPKIAILLGAFVQIEQGDLKLDQETRGSLTRMIRVSSNTDATRMLRRVGTDRLAQILQSDRFRLYDPAVNGGLWVGKEYGKAKAWKRDPMYNLSHGATAMQVARFYYLLETKRLVAAPLCDEMKEMLSKPAINHKFVRGLKGRPDTRIYRKSGSWRQWHADSAIVEHDSHRYIIVGLAKHRHGGQWLSRLVGPIDDLIGARHQVAVLDGSPR
jgi:beta-lactamase class A